MKKTFARIAVLCVLWLLLPCAALTAQEILTPDAFFARLSDTYRDIQDYSADLTITVDKEVMKGTLYYKKPNLLRIDFTEPQEQVIAVNGQTLTVYLPKYQVALVQALRAQSPASQAALATREGLALMKQNYHITFLKDPTPVPLEPDSNEMVVKLKLIWKSTEEGFRQIDLSVGADGLIRRITGITTDYRQVQMDYVNILKNRNIPEGRFTYDAPPSANMITDFLGFSAED